MVKINWSAKAKQDFKSIVTFISETSLAYAEIFRDKVIQSTEIISDYPEIGRIVPEFSKKEIREVFVWQYRIIYLYRKIDIVVLGILHQKTDFRRKPKWVFF